MTDVISTVSVSARCQVCDGTEFEPLYSVTDTNEFVPGTWEIEQCGTCKLGRLHPFPSPEEVSGFYQDTFYDDEGQRFRPEIEKLRLWAASLRGATLNKLLPDKGRLLDFGAGAGNFVQAMAGQGWDVSSVDPYSTAAQDSQIARDRNGKIEIDLPEDQFDAISLWYVIEHLWDPRTAIGEMHRILKPGGILLLAQQDFESVQAKLFKDKWLFLDPPRHLFQFSADNLNRIAEEEGFELVRIDRSSLEMGPFTILQSMLNTLTGNKNYLFRFLRSKKLVSEAPGISKWGNATMTLISILLLPVLGPLSLLIYFVLLAFRSGDIFVLYLRKPS